MSRSLSRLSLLVAAVFVVALPAASAGETNPASAAAAADAGLSAKLTTSAKKRADSVGGATASVKLRTCRSAAYYDNRLIRFRVRMARLSAAGPGQRMQMRIDVQRRFNGQKKFVRQRAEGLSRWSTSKSSANVYQRDLVLSGVIETASQYRASVAMRWVDASGKVVKRRTLRSKVCKQKRSLPRLKLIGAHAVPATGAATELIHTLTVANSGGSEAVDVPVAVIVDGQEPVIARIESIGPRQSADVVIRAPACRGQATAQIDPLRELSRLRQSMRKPFDLAACS